jgi:hypothetical protein
MIANVRSVCCDSGWSSCVLPFPGYPAAAGLQGGLASAALWSPKVLEPAVAVVQFLTMAVTELW